MYVSDDGFDGNWDGRIFDVLFERGTMNSATLEKCVYTQILKLKPENGGTLQGAIFYK